MKYLLIMIFIILGQGVVLCENDQTEWWDARWPYRKEVVGTPGIMYQGKTETVPSASFLLYGEGKTLPDGRDIVVVQDGRILPAFVRPAKGMGTGSSKSDWFDVNFESIPDEHRYYCYYGNPNPPPQEAEVSFKGSGNGIQLKIYRHPRPGQHPSNLLAMEKLLKEALKTDGSGVRQWINDPINPFGRSDNYLSEYNGFIQCSETGTYGFATNSDDASFLLIDNKLVTEWPGVHKRTG